MNLWNAIADAVGKIGSWLLSWFGQDPRVEEIRSRVAAACDFLPTVSSVTAMLTASNPTVVGVSAIAHAICAAVQARRNETISRLVGGTEFGTVNGVPIEGEDLKGGGE